MDSLTIEPASQEDYQLFVDLAKRLKAKIRINKMDNSTDVSREADFYALFGSWQGEESGEEKPYVMSGLKTYSAEEILRAGGTTAFAKLTGYDPKKLYHLKGEPLSDEEFEKALKMLTK